MKIGRKLCILAHNTSSPPKHCSVHSSVFALHKHCGAGEKVEENFQSIKSVDSLTGVILAQSRSPSCQQVVACMMRDCLAYADPLCLKDRYNSFFKKSEGKPQAKQLTEEYGAAVTLSSLVGCNMAWPLWETGWHFLQS